MTVSVTHSTPADGSFSATGATAWNATHTLTGVGTMAEQNANNVTITGGSVTGITDLAIADGGTGASTAADARTNLGLAIGTNVLAPNGSAANLTSFPTFNQNTTGTAANVTGTVAVANGGTGLSAIPENGQLLIGNGTGFSYATLTAGANVSITNGSGSIQISATGGGGGGSGAGNAYGWFIS